MVSVNITPLRWRTVRQAIVIDVVVKDGNRGTFQINILFQYRICCIGLGQQFPMKSVEIAGASSRHGLYYPLPAAIIRVVGDRGAADFDLTQPVVVAIDKVPIRVARGVAVGIIRIDLAAAVFRLQQAMAQGIIGIDFRLTSDILAQAIAVAIIVIIDVAIGATAGRLQATQAIVAQGLGPI